MVTTANAEGIAALREAMTKPLPRVRWCSCGHCTKEQAMSPRTFDLGPPIQLPPLSDDGWQEGWESGQPPQLPSKRV